jgi:hypothetical protein
MGVPRALLWPDGEACSAARVYRQACSRTPGHSADFELNPLALILAKVSAVLDVEAATAEDLVRSAEPLWDAMEQER